MPINTLNPAATTVANVKHIPKWWKTDDHFVYIGRGSKWGNPFRIGEHGSRAEVVEKYQKYVLEGKGCHLQSSLHELRGKTLVCYCHPQACHGDVLAWCANHY